MTRQYQGLRENGEWEYFEADKREDVTPSVTGYKRVKDDLGYEIEG